MMMIMRIMLESLRNEIEVKRMDDDEENIL